MKALLYRLRVAPYLAGRIARSSVSRHASSGVTVSNIQYIRNRVRAETHPYCSIRMLSSVVASSATHNLPADWNERYRPAISQLLRNVSLSSELIDRADNLGVQVALWQRYVNNMRRNLIKDPMAVLQSAERYVTLLRLLTEMLAAEDRAEAAANCTNFLADFIFKQMEVDFAQLIAEHKLLSQMTDMRLPHEWYPYARLMKRKIVYHGGPTNSGKTYHALQRLRNADPEKGGGLYCGPLRLLALEVYEQLNLQGVHTDLLTGQEKRQIPGSSHISCTLEMVNINRDYDVAVIDEIQMISDQQRGYAWTKALLGLRAREIHVCGGLEASEVVRSLAESAGDEFVLERYQRLSQLKVSSESLRGDYSKVEPGDCIVAFSKADIFSIRRQIEQSTPHRCAIIYGQLPSETRSMQARLFNEEHSGFDILVASDAIGMGLNLNIRRIIFHTTLKHHRELGVRWVDPSSVKQIAGRAGRLSSKYSVGEVTAWQEIDLAYIKSVMQWEIPPISAAGIFPSVEQIELFSKQLEATKQMSADNNNSSSSSSTKNNSNNSGSNSISSISSSSCNDISYHHDRDDEFDVVRSASGVFIESDAALSSDDQASDDDDGDEDTTRLAVRAEAGEASQRLSEIMQRFVRLSRIDKRFFMCDHDHTIVVSNWLHTIPLSLADRFVFSNAPVNMNSMVSMNMLYHFAAWYAMGRPVALNVRLAKQLPRDLFAFSELCAKHNILELYLWLSLRFPKYFIEQEQCLQQKNFAILQIEKTLLAAAKMKHDNKHATSYYSLRKLLEKQSADELPPVEYGASIRASMQEQLAGISREHRVVLLEESIDSVDRSRPMRRPGKGDAQRQRVRSSKKH